MRNTEAYPAVVTANEDPENRGRLRVACAALLGDEDSELPQWVEPLVSWGWFFIPDVGELIEIEVVTSSSEDEQHGQMSIDNLAPRWKGERHYGNEEGEAPTPINTDFLKNYGKRRGFATPGGHVLVFDDTDGDRSITLTWTNKDEERSFMTFDKDGSFLVGTRVGHTMYFNAAAGELSIIDQHGNTYSSDANGSKLINKDGATVDMNGTNIQILAGAGVTISCADAVIDAGKVQLGGQPLIEAFILGTTFINTIFNLHTHPTGVGPSGPPTVPAPPTVLSTKVFGSP